MRIIGGRCKGYGLFSPKGMQTRPTQERIRESVFNVLTNIGLAEVRVLDLFSGTGAMALEALSRGAKEAVAIDSRTASTILLNARKCHLDTCLEVIARDVLSALRQLNERQEAGFDYVFIDPPYQKNWLDPVLTFLAASDLLNKEAYLIVEHAVAEAVTVTYPYTLWRSKIYGNTEVSYLLYIGKGVDDQCK